MDLEILATRFDAFLKQLAVLNLPPELRRACQELQENVESLKTTAPVWDITEHKRLENRLKQLYDVTAALSDAVTLDQVFSIITEKVLVPDQHTTGVIFLLTDDGEYLELAKPAGVPDAMIERYARLPLHPDAPLSAAVRSGEPVWLETVEDYQTQFPEFFHTNYPVSGTQASINLPLIVNERILGGIGIGFRQPTEFSQEERTFYLTLTNHCARAIERARLLEEIQKQAEQLQHQYELTAALSRATSLDEVLAVIIEKGLKTFSYHSVVVGLISEDGTTLALIRETGAASKVIERFRQIPLTTMMPMTDAARQNTAIWIETPEAYAAAYPELYRSIQQRTETQAFVCIPLVASNQVMGTLGFGFPQPTHFSETERAFFVGLANHCAKALERAKLYEEIQQQAEQIRLKNWDLQEFASIASHDLQEPLRKVRQFVEHLKEMIDEKLTISERDYFNRIQNSVRRMQNLIDSLLRYSRVMTQAIPFQPVNLNTTLQIVLETLTEKADASVQVGNLPEIEADPVQMEQLFQNLLSNALKFHRPDVQPQVQIYAGQLTETVCEIVIQDNGIGFDPEEVERIFLPFQRLHGRSEFEGNGMGLAICRRIVERHHGKISVQSIPGKGSTFTVTLPLKQIAGSYTRATGFHR